MQWILLSILLVYIHLYIFITGSDGFMYSSVAPTAHNVTVVGTSQGSEVFRQTFSFPPPLTIMASATATGTVITIIIETNEDVENLRIECQLDDEEFVEC